MLVLALVAFLFAPGLLARSGDDHRGTDTANADLAIALLAPTLDQTELEPARRIVGVDGPCAAAVLPTRSPVVSSASPSPTRMATLAEVPIPEAGGGLRCHPLRAPPGSLLA